jgi:hypothetical protein
MKTVGFPTDTREASIYYPLYFPVSSRMSLALPVGNINGLSPKPGLIKSIFISDPGT